MDWNDAVQRGAFYAIYEGLPRQGPGTADLTRRALDLALTSGLEPRVVFDLGSGSGLQSSDLARSLPAARVVALDRHLPFVATADGRVDNLAAVVGDMAKLPWAAASADLIWSECFLMPEKEHRVTLDLCYFEGLTPFFNDQIDQLFNDVLTVLDLSLFHKPGKARNIRNEKCGIRHEETVLFEGAYPANLILRKSNL